jgi:hypothetical protein
MKKIPTKESIKKKLDKIQKQDEKISKLTEKITKIRNEIKLFQSQVPSFSAKGLVSGSKVSVKLSKSGTFTKKKEQKKAEQATKLEEKVTLMIYKRASDLKKTQLSCPHAWGITDSEDILGNIYKTCDVCEAKYIKRHRHE